MQTTSKTIHRWERNESSPRAEDLDALSTALGVTIEHLVRGDGSADDDSSNAPTKSTPPPASEASDDDSGENAAQ